jgi:phosphoglycolate phosphatase
MTPFPPDTIRAALVDLDGTLVDTLGDFTVALNAMLRELSLPALSRADIERRVGKGSEHLIRATLHAVDGDPALYPQAWAAYQRHYDAANGQHAPVYPGAREGLDFLRARGVRMACVTNKPGRFARDLLRAKDLEGYFEQVVGGDAYPERKPHPMPLLMSAQTLGVAPAQTLMVGDSSNDAQAARAAGCPVVLVTYGYNHGEPVRSVDADAWLDSLVQLADLMPAP